MKKIDKSIIITSIIAGVILIIALIALSTISSIVPNSKNTVTVEGVATIDAKPDLLAVYFNIETTGVSASQAKNESDLISEELLSRIVALGFEESELQTQGYNIYPNIYWENNLQKQNGYKSTHTLRLELTEDEFDLADDVVDAGVDSGSGIGYINFELSPELQNQYKAEALEIASKDARIKAEAVAEGFDKNLGRLVSVQVSNFGYYPWAVYSASSDSAKEEGALAREAVSNITPGEQEINARVSATFKI